MKTNITETAIHMDVLSLSNWQLLTSSFEHMFGLPSKWSSPIMLVELRPTGCTSSGFQMSSVLFLVLAVVAARALILFSLITSPNLDSSMHSGSSINILRCIQFLTMILV